MNKETLLIKVLEMLLSWNTDNSETTKVQSTNSDYIWKYVILRWYDCGVVFGKLDKIEWENYYLSGMRRLFYWKTKWLSLEDLAHKWLEDWCKLSDTISRVQITDKRISMIIPTTDEVTKNILWYKAYVE